MMVVQLVDLVPSRESSFAKSTAGHLSSGVRVSIALMGSLGRFLQLEVLEGGRLRLGCRDVRGCVFGTDVPQVDVPAESDVCEVTICSLLVGVPNLKVAAMTTLYDDVLRRVPPEIKVSRVVESVQRGKHLSLKLLSRRESPLLAFLKESNLRHVFEFHGIIFLAMNMLNPFACGGKV